MKCKIKFSIILLFTMLIANKAWTEDLKVGDRITDNGIIFYIVTSVDPNEVELSGVSTNAARGDIDIPPVITLKDGNSYAMTSIGDFAFYNKSFLKSVNIPNTVTRIGTASFSCCASLTSVTIPNSVTKIGQECFAGDHNLTSVTIPESLTSIETFVFSACRSLTSITIPNSVTSIGGYAFSGCSLTSVTIPNSVTSIGGYAFSGCRGLTSVTIPNSVTNIGNNPFADCYNLTSINVESGNSIYDSHNNCNAIINSKTNELIMGCKTSIIPNSVTSIGGDAFKGCSGLTSVTIPNSVTSIGERTFYGCSGLTSVTIPNSVKSIGYAAFYGCSGLTSIVVETGNTICDSREGCNAIIETKTNKLITGCKNTVIPSSVTSIGYAAFYGCSGLTSITIPNSVTSIGERVFEGCSGLTSVTIGNSVTSIGREAFQKCSGLTSVIIPNSVKSIGERAFYDCSGLTEINSKIIKPFHINSNVFLNNNDEFTTATLYVPTGTKTEYESTNGWNSFTNIVEMKDISLDPMEGETTVNTETLSGKSLTDNIVDDIYYNVGDDGYDATDQSIVISQTTNMAQIADKEPGADDVKNNFTGMILKVAKGIGIITVNVKTSGNAQLVVQVGNGTPMIASRTEKGDVVVSYDVKEDTYVYIYAIVGSSAVRATRTTSDNEVRIYSVTVLPGVSGIRDITLDGDKHQPFYDMMGRRVEHTLSGHVYFQGGKKFVAK